MPLRQGSSRPKKPHRSEKKVYRTNAQSQASVSEYICGPTPRHLPFGFLSRIYGASEPEVAEMSSARRPSNWQQATPLRRDHKRHIALRGHSSPGMNA